MITSTVKAIQELLLKVERVIDDHPTLTRSRAPGAAHAPPSEAEMCIARTGCRVTILVRHASARGRGSRQMHAIWGEGATPEAACVSLVERLPHWTEALS